MTKTDYEAHLERELLAARNRLARYEKALQTLRRGCRDWAEVHRIAKEALDDA